jgi:RNA polymerase sigma-70 factor (ECF subfamily)
MTVAEFNSCVDEFSDGVYRFILKNIRDDEAAKDIVQESFARFWEKRKEVTAEKAKTYLFTTAYHTMIDMIRKEKRNIEFSSRHQNLESSENSFSDLSEILEKAVNTLPEIQRSVVLLRDYEGYSYKEIGDITGLSESQVKVYIYRARMILKQYIVSIDNVV